ncbi:spermidine synthase [Helicobacter cetorum]|uniref:Polyamine aminopropyltransferase n=1 Tax=Helicobacter cetorum (strain ATCC BAA-540 / CCUG 52418 / MIT 99-5656) TaxID=1163745 RepID=I0EQY6_HELCM|nr:spermidine synthase [Helicobacter cetorum]AFI05355.1 spermidine synthase [Helicobacter cetorum MIT 99-5656]
MWITQEITPYLRKEYTIEAKLLDVRSEQNILEIFKSKDFGEIAMLNHQLLFKNFLHIESELLAHMGGCTKRELHQVLIIGGFDLELAHQLFKYETHIDFVQADEKILDSFISFFPHFHEVKNDKNFTHAKQLLDLEIKKYDLIFCLEEPNTHQIDALKRMLQKDGVLISVAKHPLLEHVSMQNALKNMGEFFPIVMPFVAPLRILSNKGYIYASKEIHPLKDLSTQKIETLENVRYYNEDIHRASFALPKNLQEVFKGIIKS